METIELDSRTFRDLSLIAKARGLTPGQAVEFLIEEFSREASPRSVAGNEPEGVKVYATYQGHRVEGVFNPRTGGLTVTSEPLAATWHRSPSGAAKAVVATLNPGVTPNRSGYDFWFVAETGMTLASIRRGAAR
jgi:hypothetical protein